MSTSSSAHMTPEGRRPAKAVGPNDLGLQIVTYEVEPPPAWVAEVQWPDGKKTSFMAATEKGAYLGLATLLGGEFVPWVGEDA